MAVFLNIDGSRICLVLALDRYQLINKDLQKGETPEERAYLRRTPRIVEKPQAGYIRRRGKRKANLTKEQTLVDFSKYNPVEPGIITCPAGQYLWERITVIVPPRTAGLAVLFGTNIGLAEEGLDSVLRKQAWQKECDIKRCRVRQIVSQHFGLPEASLDDSFVLADINGLGSKIGTGPYRLLAVMPNQKPAVIRPGITIREIAEQS